MNEYIEQLREEFAFAVEVYRYSKNEVTKVRATGHAQCASVLLDKMDGPSDYRSLTLGKMFHSLDI